MLLICCTSTLIWLIEKKQSVFIYLKCIALYKQLNNTTPSFKEPNLVGIIYVKII